MDAYPSKKSRLLCEKISSQTGGICLLGFSRGKDSVAAWLHLRNYFHTIIPFHVCTVPHLSFVDESLDYYEQYFKTKIYRFFDGEVIDSILNLIYQPESSEALLDDLELWTYSKHDISKIIKKELNISSAWTAYGINASDSIDRRIYVNQYEGKIDNHKSFYPCYDWKKELILKIIDDNKIKLSKDYLLSNRSLAGIPNIRNLMRMNELFPADYEKIKSYFPLIEAQLARNEFRKEMLNHAIQS